MRYFISFVIGLSLFAQEKKNDIRSNLDIDGDFYFYMKADAYIKKLYFKLDALKAIAKDPKLSKRIDLTKLVFAENGLKDIVSLGASSKKLAKNLYQNKIFIELKEKPEGKVWAIFKGKEHSLDGLNLMPKDTVFASYGDFKFDGMIEFTSSLIKSIAPNRAQAGDRISNQLKRVGIDWDTVVKSSAGEMGIILSFDETKFLNLPVQKKMIEFPEPSIAVLMKVNDDYISSTLDNILTQRKTKIIKKEYDADTLVRSFGAPGFLPIQLTPTIVSSKNWLIFSSSEALALRCLNVKNKKEKGLATSRNYQRYRKGLPAKGNGLFYVGSKFSEYMGNIIAQGLKEDYTAEQTEKILEMMGLSLMDPFYMIGVVQRKKDGLLVTFNSNL
ncbi:MAG: hypothetical protein HRT89_22845 [Lentisphaeria bacterium]|nr:hypothetical protein [Lentisphaeria bacterium]NQZ70899.1 hypothetical protein [Lentisphaeria bacterium]